VSVILDAMLHGRSVALLILVVIACAACSGVGTAHRTTKPEAATASTATSTTTVGTRPLACPTHPPRSVPAHQIAGTAAAMVPGHPNVLLACRYHGFNQPQPVGSLAKFARLSPAPIARALNVLPPVPKDAVFHCLVDFDERILLFFAYPDGSRLTVKIEIGGCRFATNGDRTVLAPLDSLEAALGHDPTP